MTVRRRLDDAVRRNVAGGTENVFDNDRFAERLGKLWSDQPRHGVHGAAGRKTYNEMNWLFRVIGLRERFDGRDQQRCYSKMTDQGLGHDDCFCSSYVHLKARHGIFKPFPAANVRNCKASQLSYKENRENLDINISKPYGRRPAAGTAHRSAAQAA